MPKKSFSAKLTSVGEVNNCYIYIQNLPTENDNTARRINLKPETQKKWGRTAILVDVDNSIPYEIWVKAYAGTGWKFQLLNDTGKVILELEGETGDQPEEGNYSKRTGKINLNAIV